MSHPQNRNYIIYYSDVKRGPNHGDR